MFVGDIDAVWVLTHGETRGSTEVGDGSLVSKILDVLIKLTK